MTELIEENRSSPEMYSDTPRGDGDINPHMANGTLLEESANGIRNGDYTTMISLTDITLEDAVSKIKQIEQANLLLRDYLRKNNEEVKRQYESLMTLKKKEKEKFDQTKAVITALRNENEEMQVRLMGKDESMRELEKSIKSLQIKKEARSKEVSQDEDITDAVYVSVENQESKIAELKSTIATKEDCITLLQADLSKHKQEIKTYQDSAQQLLKDLESQQALKAATDEENRLLNQELVDVKKKLHEQLHIQLSSTKRELEAQHGKRTSEDFIPEFPAEEHISLPSLITPESLDDLMEKAQSLEEAKYDDVEKMKALLEKETSDKQQLQQKIQELSQKVTELTQQNSEAMQKIVVIEKEKSEQIKELCQDYEAKLTEKAKENLEKKQREPANTEDIEVLRSQILSLIKEVQEAERKISDMTRTIHHKDDRIKVLNQNVDDSEQQRLGLSHEYRMLMQHLQVQMNAQRQANEANVALKQDNRQLQLSFDKLIADNRELMNLVETYKAEMDRWERERGGRRGPGENNMEELNRLAAEVIAAEEALSLKDDQLTEIRGRYNHIEEEVELLRIQAETYKSDFSCEREARTKLAQEKEELMEALRKCQEETLAYKEDIREINQRQFRELQGRLHRRSQEASPPSHVYAEEQQGGAEAAPRLNEVELNGAVSRPPTLGPVVSEMSGHYPLAPPPSQASFLPQPMGQRVGQQSHGRLPPPGQTSTLPQPMGQRGGQQSCVGLPPPGQTSTLPQPLGPTSGQQSYAGLPPPGQMAGMRPNMPASTLPPQWTLNTKPGVRHPASVFQTQGQEAIRLSEEEVGDGNLTSLVQYDCPSCGAQFPDVDTLHLHVPDCMDGR